MERKPWGWAELRFLARNPAKDWCITWGGGGGGVCVEGDRCGAGVEELVLPWAGCSPLRSVPWPSCFEVDVPLAPVILGLPITPPIIACHAVKICMLSGRSVLLKKLC